MKILFLSSRYPPDSVGGAERVAQTLATSLAANGDEVAVLTTAVDGREGDREADGIRIRSVALRNVYDFSQPTSGRVLKPLWHLIDSANPFMRETIARVIGEERPDVVHTHLLTGFSPTAWEAAHDCGVPVVHTLHDHYLLCARSTMAIDGVPCENQHLECALLSRPRIRATRRVAAVVGVSRFILDRHRAFGAFENAYASVIPNPCHLVGHALPIGRVGETVRLGFLGRLEVNKGIQVLLEATRDLPDSGWTLAVAGTGDPTFTAMLKARHATTKVSFVGQVDPAEFISGVDVMVVPSLVPETFGLAAAESLAMGRPVVASTRGALPELIHEGRNGFLFDPASPGALAATLNRLIGSATTLAAMEKTCRDSASAFAPSAVAAQYRVVYKSVVRS